MEPNTVMKKLSKERLAKEHEETGWKVYPELPTPDYTFLVSTTNWTYEVRLKKMLTPKEAACIAYHNH